MSGLSKGQIGFWKFNHLCWVLNITLGLKMLEERRHNGYQSSSFTESTPHSQNLITFFFGRGEWGWYSSWDLHQPSPNYLFLNYPPHLPSFGRDQGVEKVLVPALHLALWNQLFAQGKQAEATIVPPLWQAGQGRGVEKAAAPALELTLCNRLFAKSHLQTARLRGGWVEAPSLQRHPSSPPAAAHLFQEGRGSYLSSPGDIIPLLTQLPPLYQEKFLAMRLVSSLGFTHVQHASPPKLRMPARKLGTHIFSCQLESICFCVYVKGCNGHIPSSILIAMTGVVLRTFS